MSSESTDFNARKVIVEANAINKSFLSGRGNLEVLKGASLQLHEGEMVLLLGASGTGKSTFLHILGTLDQPDSGSVSYDGLDVKTLKHNELSKFRNEKIGFVYQFHHLLPDFNALENVMLPGLIMGLQKENAAEKAFEMLKAVGLENRDTHKPNQLSGGEAQRVAVARALFNKPQVVYADEPTGNLDNKTGAALLELFLELNARFNQTFFIATHNERLMEQIERRYLIKDGVITDSSKG
jgi:lipoprotein-releasing system ATP-binding protein